jgi:hypothetical protein
MGGAFIHTRHKPQNTESNRGGAEKFTEVTVRQ